MPSKSVALFFEMNGSVVYKRLRKEMSGGGGCENSIAMYPSGFKCIGKYLISRRDCVVIE